MIKFRNCAALLSLAVLLPSTASASLMYDQDISPEIIFGSGNANGSFTVNRANGIELGLRGKLRHNASGAPENTYNSNGDGTYSFDAVQAFGQSPNTAVWSFEWSINVDYDNSTGLDLDDLTYQLAYDSDASVGVNFQYFDVINALTYFDHAIGDNTTTNGGGSVAADDADYASLIASNNIAQNSWKAHWFLADFDPTVDGEYDFMLTAFDGERELASTRMQIIAGQGAAEVPEPTGVALLLSALAGLCFTRRKMSKRA